MTRPYVEMKGRGGLWTVRVGMVVRFFMDEDDALESMGMEDEV